MNNEQLRIEDHLAAAGDVIDDALNAFRAEKPQAGAILNAAILQGAIVTLRTSVALTTGLATVSVDLTMPDGKTACISTFSIEYMPPATLN